MNSNSGWAYSMSILIVFKQNCQPGLAWHSIYNLGSLEKKRTKGAALWVLLFTGRPTREALQPQWCCIILWNGWLCRALWGHVSQTHQEGKGQCPEWLPVYHPFMMGVTPRKGMAGAGCLVLRVGCVWLCVCVYVYCDYAVMIPAGKRASRSTVGVC